MPASKQPLPIASLSPQYSIVTYSTFTPIIAACIPSARQSIIVTRAAIAVGRTFRPYMYIYNLHGSGNRNRNGNAYDGRDDKRKRLSARIRSHDQLKGRRQQRGAKTKRRSVSLSISARVTSQYHTTPHHGTVLGP